MKILLLDDEVISNFLHTTILKQIGYNDEIVMASNGQMALDMIMEWTVDELPDIILMDLNMPVMNGFEFLSAFEQLHPAPKKQISIYVVSSSEFPEDIDRARSYNIINYLVKPVSESDMRSILSDRINS